jgi:soluble lytic murein transglycosylase-like protein
MLADAAEAEGLPSALVRSVAKAESAYNPNAVSVKGAVGLMQLMPATASELGVESAVPQENALGGAKYLRNLLVRYNGNAVLALAAYNAGPNAVSKYRGLPPYAETRQYVERVLREYLQQQKQTRPGPKPLVAGTPAKKPSATD